MRKRVSIADSDAGSGQLDDLPQARHALAARVRCQVPLDLPEIYRSSVQRHVHGHDCLDKRKAVAENPAC